VTEVLVWLPPPGSSRRLAHARAPLAPACAALRGVVTLGLVFIGGQRDHEWSSLTGGPRRAPAPGAVAAGLRPQPTSDAFLTRTEVDLLMLVLLLLAALAARNLARSRSGPGPHAIRRPRHRGRRHRGELARYKTVAFGDLVVHAGCAGALPLCRAGYFDPTRSPAAVGAVHRMVLIGGAGTVSVRGPGRFLIRCCPADPDGPVSCRSSALASIRPTPTSSRLLYGVLIIVFLIFERAAVRRGGRLRNYWRPGRFSY